jgi:hypothetical protein
MSSLDESPSVLQPDRDFKCGCLLAYRSIRFGSERRALLLQEPRWADHASHVWQAGVMKVAEACRRCFAASAPQTVTAARGVKLASEAWQRFVQPLRHQCRFENAADHRIRRKRDEPPGAFPPDDRLPQHSRSPVQEAYTVAAR